MKTVSVVGVALLIGLAGCDRISSLFGGGAEAHAHDAGAAVAAGASSSAAAASASIPGDLSSFEGEIELTAKAKSSPQPMSLGVLVKNSVLRIDLPAEQLASPDLARFTGGGKVYALLHPADKKLFVVLDGKRQAIDVDLDQVGDRMKALRHGPGGQDAPSPPPPKVTKTGKKETVAGYTCEDWEVVNADRSKLIACVAEMGASFFHLPLTGIPTEHVWALELLDGKHFPLKGISYDKEGAESGRVEVTKLDKRSLDASMFEVPLGYKELSLDDVLKGLGDGMPDEPHKHAGHVPGQHHHGHGHH